MAEYKYPDDYSGPVALRLEISVSVAPRLDWKVPQEIPEGLNYFDGQDWDSWLDDYAPNVSSAQILRFETAEDPDLDPNAQRVVYTLDLFSEWEMSAEEFEWRMAQDWNEGYWLPEPVPWYVEKRSASCICHSCELIAPDAPPIIQMAGESSRTELRVGDGNSLAGWEILGSGLPARRPAAQELRKQLGELMDWIETATSGPWAALVTDPVLTRTYCEHEYHSRIGLLPDLRPTLATAVGLNRDEAVTPEALAAHFRSEALAGLLAEIAMANQHHAPLRATSRREEVVLWPLVNFGPAWRVPCQREAVDGIQRFLDRGPGKLGAISLKHQRTQPFELEMNAASVNSLLVVRGETKRFRGAAEVELPPMRLEQVDPAENGCPIVDGLHLFKLAKVE